VRDNLRLPARIPDEFRGPVNKTIFAGRPSVCDLPGSESSGGPEVAVKKGGWGSVLAAFVLAAFVLAAFS
jgi:hypothetical protein